ncbi:UDP-glucose 4-epimerase GalE [Pandoraea faecigallinarum]|uniref:UDP-glucose 4-epimerase n=1 Tax=Pandoraea faecigallinarum TaxID=656179 RepID=A0A0H3WX44_9BURK|nr:UDP-glucose 4-epimerase GalE [Pandoraea faecigallinarum]AKM32307.1 UDP-glucose 4-epimerase GalE [Pandoraea faecigallinarum]
MRRETVLVTGGTGYIGSHTCVALLDSGFDVVIADNLVNSRKAVVGRIAGICGRTPSFIEADICSPGVLDRIFTTFDISSVIHFAALKAVGESVARPVDYYCNNVGGVLALIHAMQAHHVRRLVFSSSAAVYGNPERVPVDESCALCAASPYGQTKLVAETMLRDTAHADPTWRIAVLRYFNPVGAHESGRIGEDTVGAPNNLMPWVTRVALGRAPRLKVYGNDWDTVDGTGMRDYVHVMDIAQGHVMALDALQRLGHGFTVNLGAGRGYTVLQLIRAFEASCAQRVPYELMPRREGDVACCYAATSRARELLGWEASRSLERMCIDHWRWQVRNPNGYG